ncbi:MAG: alpha-D-ribose 1-methylphosphonate 5-triphosphate diphosphatase [Rhodoplanes sp.]|uniref:alpha-D-ribose 1-methylphosphonate 5-triphosphate diphosphatase n=1 Tax=Rhodoplanes sp. TaxID=1968906 RepID=UPI00179B7A94|nr:alpha-D-ribose 1-methylphosphonate 5-triphosphate diphosphatase [Rhodoplanes sp.]NVO16232.1 alpha-D-ribose 1-methylphosphonate 5-triphosphate diphosphatase [Rhodoplanes sp.]
MARTAAGLTIADGQCLIDDGFVTETIAASPDGLAVAPEVADDCVVDASGLLVLPGIVDIHGDAFERQIMPRPGVDFPIDVALADSDRQAVANGITTVFHGVTWSWEPGLRGPDNARRLLAAIERLRPTLSADTRFHLRHEVFNLDAEATIVEWLSDKRIDILAFNDHMAATAEGMTRKQSLARMVERSGVSREEFLRIAARVRERRSEVPGSVARIAAAAEACGVPMLSHDDASPEQRLHYRALGCRVAEFPTTLETAQEAAAGGDAIVLGAPNVVRGGSHTGWTRASDMIAQGLCSVLASDYYYPAQLLAAFRLAADGTLPLARAWALVSAAPAAAAGLLDRGRIAPGLRADLLLVDATAQRPRLVATIAAGRIVHLVEADRLMRAPARHPARLQGALP